MGKAELAPGEMVAFGTSEKEETEEITWKKVVEYKRKIPQSPEES